MSQKVFLDAWWCSACMDVSRSCLQHPPVALQVTEQCPYQVAEGNNLKPVMHLKPSVRVLHVRRSKQD